MSVIRTHTKSSGFAVVNKTYIFDKTLSAKAKGILTYFFAHGDGWEARQYDVEQNMSDGRASIKSGFEELKQKGYLIVKKRKDDKGLWVWQSDIYDTPQKVENAGNPSAENPRTDNPYVKVSADKHNNNPRSNDLRSNDKGQKPEEAEKPNAFKRLETINPNHAQKCVIELERKGFNLEQVLKPWTDEDLQTLLIEAVKKASPARAGYKWADFITFTDSCEILPTTKQAPKVLESARPNFEIGQEINTPNGKDTIIELTNAWICTEHGDYRWDECQA